LFTFKNANDADKNWEKIETEWRAAWCRMQERPKLQAEKNRMQEFKQKDNGQEVPMSR
jgi:hypothetical protein